MRPAQVRPTAAAFALLLLTAAAAAPASANLLSDQDERLYQRAFAAARDDKFDLAHSIARDTREKLPAKVLRWLEYTRPQTKAGFADITGFIRENPHWPMHTEMQRRAEEAIGAATPAAQLLDWFQAHPPVTVDGKEAYGKALLASGQSDKGVKVLREAWVNGSFGVLQERQFLASAQDHLRLEDHAARLDRLLWERQEAAAQRMLLRVDPAHRQLAQARLAMIENKGVEGALAKVPPELLKDSGLLYERVRWRRQHDMQEEAIALMKDAGNKVRPDLWWTERAALARYALQRNRAAEAYELVKSHGQTDGQGLAEAEWLAGWIALRFLDQKDAARQHFKRLFDTSATPMSQSRGAYWLARTAEAAGRQDEATKWFNRAAQHVTTFYGQLSASRLNKEQAWPLPADPLPSAEDIEQFERHELVRAARMLAELGEAEQIRPLIIRLNDIATTPGRRALAANLASTLGRADMALGVARRSDREGVPLIASGYPLPPFEISGPEKALVMAVIRQESSFNTSVVSVAGALGLMQLMPATAEKVAKTMNVSYSKGMLTGNPDYNVRLGSAYLSQLLAEFNGSYVLSLAAYNAGPSRARRWMNDYGDPRSPDVDTVDWIESIPFSETRNYVQRVMESVQVYRRRLGITHLAQSLDRDIKR
ncbi:MAG: lytic transglycosylase domain-containing protein [Rhodospirillales bacterium]|nr:lytic transglycosylase domain-containing protein [Rhodospirillales bacterium]